MLVVYWWKDNGAFSAPRGLAAPDCATVRSWWRLAASTAAIVGVVHASASATIGFIYTLMNVWYCYRSAQP